MAGLLVGLGALGSLGYPQPVWGPATRNVILQEDARYVVDSAKLPNLECRCLGFPRPGLNSCDWKTCRLIAFTATGQASGLRCLVSAMTPMRGEGKTGQGGKFRQISCSGSSRSGRHPTNSNGPAAQIDRSGCVAAARFSPDWQS